jgi:hypothetical protein
MKSEGISQEIPSLFLHMKKLGLQFVTFLRGESSSSESPLMGLLVGVSIVTVLLGSFDGEASQVVTGLVVLGGGLFFRTRGFGKRRSRLYENDPDSGKNDI